MAAQEPGGLTINPQPASETPALKPPSQPPGSSEALLELYKMAVEMADRVSARRGTANAFFLTVQSAMLSAVGIAATGGRQVPWWAALILALVGVSISATWWLQLRSYRTLNGAKFHVINSVEPRLPIQVFSTEWEILTRSSTGRWWTRYSELGQPREKSPGYSQHCMPPSSSAYSAHELSE